MPSRYSHASQDIDKEIICQYVPGSRLLLASPCDIYSCFCLYWECIFQNRNKLQISGGRNLFLHAFDVCANTFFVQSRNPHLIRHNLLLLQARGACASFVSGFVTFMSIGGFPSFIEDMKVSYYILHTCTYLYTCECGSIKTRPT